MKALQEILAIPIPAILGGSAQYVAGSTKGRVLEQANTSNAKSFAVCIHNFFQPFPSPKYSLRLFDLPHQLEKGNMASGGHNKAVIKNADMSEEMQADAIDCATQVGRRGGQLSWVDASPGTGHKLNSKGGTRTIMHTRRRSLI